MLILIAVLVMLAGLGIAGYAVIRTTPADRAVELCRAEVTRQLKTPATARFSGETTSHLAGGDSYNVQGHVDAQNSFGALLRKRYGCVADVGAGTASASILD